MDDQKQPSVIPPENPPPAPPNTGTPAVPAPPQENNTIPAPSPDEEEALNEQEIADEDAIEENDDDLLADQEEDLFWMVQKIIWEIVKIGLIIGIIGFVIWAIWIPSDSETNEGCRGQTCLSPTKTKEQDDGPSFWDRLFGDEDISDETSAGQTEKSSIQHPTSNIPSSKALKSTDDPSSIIPKTESSTIISSTQWIQKSYDFLNARVSDLIPSSVPNVRRQTIDHLITEVGGLIIASERLQQRLNYEYEAYSARSKEASQDSVLNEKAFFEALNRFDGNAAEIFLRQKADAEQLVMTNSSFASGRKILLQNMAHYDKRLRVLYENLIANKDALIYDVKVVNFPQSTLEIILSPREWRAGNN